MKLKIYFLFLLLYPFISFGQFDLIKGDLYSDISSFIVHKDKLYFSARSSDEEYSQIWVFDSTEPISSINPKILVNLNSTNSSPNGFINYNDKLFFNANDKLYSYDSNSPTSNDNPKVLGNSGNGFIVYNDKLYYEEASEYPNSWMWVYDDNQEVSSSNPKKLINDPKINTTSLDFRFKNIVYNDKLYYCGSNLNDRNYELYVYDSKYPITNTNPKKINEINPKEKPSTPTDFVIFKDRLFFTADDGTGEELFEYNEMNDPKKVYDINPSAYGGRPQYKTVYNDDLYFSGTDQTHGIELWKYSGTSIPTLAIDINPNKESSLPTNLKVYSNKLFFIADDGVHGYELSMYDYNTPFSNTNPKVYDLYIGKESGLNPNNDFIEYNGDIYFSGKSEPFVYSLNRIKSKFLNVKDIKVSNLTEVYPNPTNKNININSNYKIDKIEIYNFTGQLINQYFPEKNNYSIDFQQKGTYLISIVTNNELVTKKIIVK
ncbi:T9SS type A sorting domain-containing protein [Algoriella sp.]|uniref:T9SS type A sorting domain-containing protein n=1 Tax=Algoriella sp. TaxID=1872434 RepID=UPI001B213247|nr:T9SS type A sorting domain-containing protein [Algoriella sp.]MBO6211695.1 T9SS type A sorting domain-containing protein [Algoriella sp.]